MCVFCGEDCDIFLTIDHINNDGAIHRKSLKSNWIYRWLRLNNYPTGFQTACYNCNCAKQYVGEEKLRAVLAAKKEAARADKQGL